MPARPVGRQHFALNTPLAESARHHYAIARLQLFGATALFQFSGVHPDDFDFAALGQPGVPQRLFHTDISVLEFDVFSHQGDAHRLPRLTHCLNHGLPV